MRKIFKGLCVSALLLGLAGCSTLEKRHDAAQPDKLALQAFQPTLQVNRLWGVTAGTGALNQYLRLEPGLNSQTIYTSDATGTVMAFNTQNGNRYWVNKTKIAMDSGPAVGRGKLFLGTDTGLVVALSKENGQLLWHRPVSSVVLANPTANNPNNLVYVKSENDHLYAFTQNAGHLRWTAQQPSPDLILRVNSSPLLSGNRVFSGYDNGHVVAYNAYNGQPLWTQVLAEPEGDSVVDRMVDIDANLLVSRGVLYAAAYQGKIAAMSQTSGRIIWSKKLSTYTGLAQSRSRIYATDTEGRVWAFDKSTGNVMWHQDNLAGRGLSGPAVVGNALVVGDADGYLHFLSLNNGEFVARTRMTRSAIMATPLVRGRQMFVLASNGQLTSYSVG